MRLRFLFLALTLASCTWIGNDVDGDGLPIGEDCDDRDPEVLGMREWFQDLDGDGYGAGEGELSCTPIPFASEVGSDCDDADASVNPDAIEVCDGVDEDCDDAIDEGACGTGDTGLPPDTSVPPVPTADTGIVIDTGPFSVQCWFDLDGDGYGAPGYAVVLPLSQCPPELASQAGDCNDVDADVNPSAADIPANWIDEDCDGVDLCYADADGDGFGSVLAPGASLSCTFGGFAVRGDDCDDADAAVHPGASEICDGKDSDCQFGPGPDEEDVDNDGVRECEFDCDDYDPDRFPTNPENCTDAIDRDCDGNPSTSTFYVDLDGDGFGDDTPIVTDCIVPSGAVAKRGDCDDGDPNVNPDRIEIVGDEIDNDCDGTLSCFLDADNDQVGASTVITSPSCTIDGAAQISGDCNDAVAAINPFATEVLDGLLRDENCDGLLACNSDEDFDGYGALPVVEVPFCRFPSVTDCGPTDPDVNPGADEVCNGVDDDCDGVIPLVEIDGDGDGAVDCTWVGPAGTPGDDCNDTDPNVVPGGTEVAGDGVDQDCDGVDDCYEDLDGDGVGAAPAVAGISTSCDADVGWSSFAGDCDDADPRAFPGNVELCDGVDSNCDGVMLPTEADVDQDGTPACAGDCDDEDPARSPAFGEICGNAVDENCDGSFDAAVWYPDVDGDGYGDPGAAYPASCTAPAGAVARGGDCNDSDPSIHPYAQDVPADGIDQNCDGLFACFVDQDGDGVGSTAVANVPTCAITVSGDCDDSDPDRFPGNVESCDGVDNDCAGGVPSDEVDGDGDGVVLCAPWTGGPTLSGGDCDDSRATAYPGAPERCNGRDDDCDGIVPPNELDTDGDGFVVCPGWTGPVGTASGDCDDTNAQRSPGLAEVCDGIDNDCAQGVPAAEVDGDGDLYVDCAVWVGAAGLSGGDCDDADPDVNPGATDSPGDGIDGDCTGADRCFVDADGDDYGAGADIEGSGLDCTAIVGLAAVAGDCNDSVAAVHPGAAEVCDGVDTDCSGSPAAGEVDADGDGVLVCAGDCDDGNPGVYPGATEICNNAIDEDCDGNATGSTWYSDLDGDGYGDPATLQTGCTVPSGAVTQGGDCDDAQSFVNPGATEIPGNAVDEDCSGTRDCYLDADADTWGTTTVVQAASCSSPGFSTSSTDCDDTAPLVHPGAPEICDGRNNDCANGTPATEIDNDGDGVVECAPFVGGALLTGGDCDDADPSVYAGAAEACDGVDNDCDGLVPANEVDDDGDGFVGCVGWSGGPGLAGGDCDDTEPTTFPGATEVCDGRDNNCAGGIPASELDADTDGYASCAVWVGPPGTLPNDCDDQDASRNPGGTEVPADGVDQDCDGVDTCWRDLDDDGFGSVLTDGLSLDCVADAFRAAVGGDCNDNAAGVNPGAAEICDGVDTDCTPGNEVDEVDQDGDGVLLCAGDCDDLDPDRFPGNVEDCTNAIDEDCDGSAQGGTFYPDNDGDSYGAGAPVLACTAPGGHVAASGDCDDTNNAIYPGATEVVGNEIDENCNGVVTCWVDSDEDDFGTSSTTTAPSCLGTGVAQVNGDCNDANPNVFPQASDTRCDGLDTACLGSIPPVERDTDSDGFVTCTPWVGSPSLAGGDCDDSDALRYPTSAELCDGVDNDCNGSVPANEIDDDGDDYVECSGWSGGGGIGSGDCNDANANVHPGATERCDGLDNDCTGGVPGGEVDNDGDLQVECTGWTGGGGLSSGDCNDAVATIYTGAPETPGDQIDQDCDGGDLCYVDADADDYGTSTTVGGSTLICDGEVGKASVPGDCNDSEAASFPGNPEVCDGIDNDCVDGPDFVNQDGDELDSDGDGAFACDGDCDDEEPLAYPGATEDCGSPIDEDCDGNPGGATYYRDVDFDTYGTPLDTVLDCTAPPGYVEDGGDCDDTNASVHPGAAEVAGDDLDNDCSGTHSCYVDADGDGYGTTTTVQRTLPTLCDSAGSSSVSTDCDDTRLAVYPSAPELCDGLDNDCVGGVPVTEIDNDSDLYVECAVWVGTGALTGGDCDDTRAEVHPGALEICDGRDDDCVDGVPPNELDDDADLYVECSGWTGGGGLDGGDCDDTRAQVYPGAPELCDGLDDNCDTTIPGNEIDDDGDTYVECSPWSGAGGTLGGDCNDAEPAAFPGNPEICDGIDNNCNTTVDDVTSPPQWWPDLDDDGYGDENATPVQTCTPPVGSVTDGTDCDDGNPDVNPGAPEVCDGVDNDCNAGTLDASGVYNVDTKESYDSLQAAFDALGGPGELTVCGSVPGGATLGQTVTITGYGGTITAGPTLQALFVGDGSNTIVRSVTLDGGTGTDGGNLYVAPAANVTLESVTLVNGSAINGGGAYVEGILAVDNAVFDGNQATQNGAGLACVGCTVTGTSLAVLRNDAGAQGGGLYVEGSTASVILSDGLSASNNTADQGAGVFVISGTLDVARGYEIGSNTAGADGGALYAQNALVSFTGGAGNWNTNRATGATVVWAESSAVTLEGITMSDNGMGLFPLWISGGTLDANNLSVVGNDCSGTDGLWCSGATCRLSGSLLQEAGVTAISAGTTLIASSGAVVVLDRSTVSGAQVMADVADPLSRLCYDDGGMGTTWVSSPTFAPDVELDNMSLWDLNGLTGPAECTAGNCLAVLNCP